MSEVIFINVADIKDPNDQQGRSYREVNRAQTHAIAIGALVELEGTGERLYVMAHRRDCDQTPLYSLGMHECVDEWKWQNGYPEYCLAVIASQSDAGVKGVGSTNEGALKQ